MNFKKFTVGSVGKSVLVNVETVCEIHSNADGSCNMYFITGLGEEQAYIKVNESMEKLATLLID